MPQNLTQQPAPQMLATPASKEVSTKSTAAARASATCGPAVTANELRKNKKKRTGPNGMSDAPTLNQLADTPQTPHYEPEVKGHEGPTHLDSITIEKPDANTTEPRITLQPVPLPDFFEESLDILPPSPSPNTSINQSQAELLMALQMNEAISSTPYADNSTNQSTHQAPPPLNQPLTPQPQSVRNRLIEAEERGNALGNSRTRNPLDKYTKGPFPLIHYAHPTAIFDNIDLNLVGDWEDLPKGKLLAQPFGPGARSTDMHPQLKTLLFAAIVEITGSRDVSVCAPRPKPSTYRTPFSFLIYNISDAQAQVLLERRIWSSAAITFSVSTLNPSCPRYMFSIKGLTTMDDCEVLKAVNEVWHDQTSLVFLQRICHNHPESLQHQAIQTLQKFVNSPEVTRLDTKLQGNTIAPVYNIYANGTLIGDDNIWSQIRAFYADRTYALQAQDPGITIVAPYRCSICHAADHPRGLCPFPTIEGWNGPKRRDPSLGGPGGPGPDGRK